MEKTLFVAKTTQTSNNQIRVGLVELEDSELGFGSSSKRLVHTPFGEVEINDFLDENPVIDRYVIFVAKTSLQKGDKITVNLDAYDYEEQDYETKDGDIITFKKLTLK